MRNLRETMLLGRVLTQGRYNDDMIAPAAAIDMSGMTAAAAKFAASATNLANMGDAGVVTGTPSYTPTGAINPAAPVGAAVSSAVTLRPASFVAYSPISPTAAVQGLVIAPEIDPISEVSNQLQAGNAYAFSLKALQVADETQQSLLDLRS